MARLPDRPPATGAEQLLELADTSCDRDLYGTLGKDPRTDVDRSRGVALACPDAPEGLCAKGGPFAGYCHLRALAKALDGRLGAEDRASAREGVNDG